MCLGDSGEAFYDPKVNPLVRPCLCNSFIHLQCMRTWLDLRKKVEKVLKQVKVSFQKFSCELCQSPYPLRFKTTDGGRHSLLDLELQNEQNYLVLESAPKPDGDKTVHVLMTRSLWIYKVGRGHKADMTISDIAISRLHAEIKFDGVKFTLQDSDSKFGTFVQV